ncbi:hypothetical protein NIES4071_76180 [Calothrix sp. NIES-4071]|nr:hypothetical protein NIES4071_76180 [Calothrix sp. NIES-4071]BAZ61893.1 hypothetical protein NIES4105_76130 [Calothrix sp. NIES-4105]
MNSKSEDDAMLQEAQERLLRLSPDRLRVVVDFIGYLEEREENEATSELLNIPGFKEKLQRAKQQVQAGEVVKFDSIRRHV